MFRLVTASLVELFGTQVWLLNYGVQRRFVNFALDLVVSLVLWFYIAVAVALDIHIILS